MTTFYNNPKECSEFLKAINGLPNWINRAATDSWPFGIALKSGIKIAFNSIDAVEFVVSKGKNQVWLRLETEKNYEINDTSNKYIEVFGAERGIWVKLNEVTAFWERADT